jgi:alpha-L-arabinofuranosidase
VTISLTGVEKVQPEAKLITLSGKTPNATNTIANPEAIVPVERKIEVDGPKFEQSIAPYSINVLELNY